MYSAAPSCPTRVLSSPDTVTTSPTVYAFVRSASSDGNVLYLPLVYSVKPILGLGLFEVDGDTEGEGLVDVDGLWLALGDCDNEVDADGLSEAETDDEGLIEAEILLDGDLLALGDCDKEIEADGLSDGEVTTSISARFATCTKSDGTSTAVTSSR